VSKSCCHCLLSRIPLLHCLPFEAPLAAAYAGPRACAFLRVFHFAMPKGIGAPGPWDLPGDVAHLANEGLAEGEDIWVRLATIVRARRLDLRLLMDAHDLHNRGMIDINTFQRSLCYALGEQWNELGCTTDEFAELTRNYLTRVPKNPGEPIPCVMWQQFTTHVQSLADKVGVGGQGNY